MRNTEPYWRVRNALRFAKDHGLSVDAAILALAGSEPICAAWNAKTPQAQSFGYRQAGTCERIAFT
jgi:hypothetical protein